jgi:hypothetical protein
MNRPRLQTGVNRGSNTERFWSVPRIAACYSRFSEGLRVRVWLKQALGILERNGGIQ